MTSRRNSLQNKIGFWSNNLLKFNESNRMLERMRLGHMLPSLLSLDPFNPIPSLHSLLLHLLLQSPSQILTYFAFLPHSKPFHHLTIPILLHLPSPNTYHPFTQLLSFHLSPPGVSSANVSSPHSSSTSLWHPISISSISQSPLLTSYLSTH